MYQFDYSPYYDTPPAFLSEQRFCINRKNLCLGYCVFLEYISGGTAAALCPKKSVNVAIHAALSFFTEREV